eukprot:gene2170-18115_t
MKPANWGLPAGEPRPSHKAGIFIPTQKYISNNAASYDTWFQFADSDADGRVTGKDAVQFFERSGLPRPLLAKWQVMGT